MKWGLNLKFICYTVFIVVFISLVFSAVFLFQSRRALLREFTNRAESLVRNLALNIEIPLLIENRPAIRQLAENLLQEKDAQSVVIKNQQGETMVALQKGQLLFPWQKETITWPVYFSPETKDEAATTDMSPFFQETEDESGTQGRPIGTIEVLFSRKTIIRSLFLIRWWIFFAATLAAVIGGIAALYFSRTLIMPMQRLAGAAYAIARGNWGERLEVHRTDELGQLTESFNIMAASLEQQREQLEQTYRELTQKEKMAEIGNFSMIIAHELKNPLGIIKGSVDIIAKDSTDPALKQTMVSYIQDEVRRLSSIIDDFLSFARPRPPRKTLTDVNTLVRRVAEIFVMPEELDKQIELRVRLGAPPALQLDEAQIFQVLLNLVNNATQAIERVGTITIATGQESGCVIVSVGDNGPGIGQSVQQTLFEPFVTTKSKGTGLGLAIVKKFVENHQGDIQVESSPAGTTFTIRLPVDEEKARSTK